MSIRVYSKGFIMKIHWFSITVLCDYDFGLQLWNYFFSFELGALSNSSRVGRGFQHIDIALQEAKLYWLPFPQKNITYDYVHFELPGSACDVVLPERFTQFYAYLKDNGMKFRVTRLDLAFDNCPFTPADFFDRTLSDDCFTYAKRETFTFTSSPEYLNQDGSKGSDTTYIGSRSSTRFLRVYNERGFTRLEIVVKEDRAVAVADQLFQGEYTEWANIAKAHLQDFIRFKEWDKWHEFINSVDRADLVISAARKISLSKIRAWLVSQVSPALSVVYDVLGEEETFSMLRQMIIDARNKRDRSRYSAVLAMRSPFEDLSHVTVSMFPPDIDPDWDLVEPDFQVLNDTTS